MKRKCIMLFFFYQHEQEHMVRSALKDDSTLQLFAISKYVLKYIPVITKFESIKSRMNEQMLAECMFQLGIVGYTQHENNLISVSEADLILFMLKYS